MTLTARAPHTYGSLAQNNWGGGRLNSFQVGQGFAWPNLVLTVLRDGGQFLAICDELPMYGEGSDPGEAAADFVRSLATLHRELDAARDRLAPELRAQLELLEGLSVPPLAIAG